MYGIIATWRMALEGISEAADMLKKSADAGDSIETAIRAVEDFEFYKSVGYGGLPNEEMEVELDAAFMDGDTLDVGCVGAIKDYANPVSIARMLSKEPVNNFLVGAGAEKYELLSCTGDFVEYSPYLDENGNLAFQEDFMWQHFNASFSIKVTYSDMEVKIYQVNFANSYIYCLAEGTKITLANHKTKNIEDITYEDNLLVWDFDNGCFAESKPLWIKKVQVAEEYNFIKFNNGVELKTVADHRIFNVESQKFTYTMNEEDTPIGTTIFMEDGTTAKLIERKVVKERVNYYNIITDYHMNLFANGILTSLRLNNLYKIENMKFIKDDRKLVEKTEFIGIPDKYFYGLRLAEQPKEINQGNDVKHTKTLKEYVERILKLAK